MKDKQTARVLSGGAMLVALLLLVLTVPEGLPWGASSMRAVMAACVAVALSAGLVAALAFRFFGWRVAVGLSLGWIFSPWVWNRAVTGDRKVIFASAAVAAAWCAVRVLLRVTRRARDVVPNVSYDRPFARFCQDERPNRLRDALAWAVLVAGFAFAGFSLVIHDYRLGEPAGVYARGVVEDADGRIIVLNGLCDAQVRREAERRRGGRAVTISLLDRSSAGRERMVGLARELFPNETNLWVAARIGVAAFAEAAARTHPDRFYVMNGRSTTLAAWERRWNAFRPYLDSSDPFVPFARRTFASEGIVLARDLASGKSGSHLQEKYELYRRVYDEVKPGDLSALVGMSEMIRGGYAVPEDEKETVRSEARRRLASWIASREKPEAVLGTSALAEWNNEMVRQMEKGELALAGRIARAILANPEWRNFIPANAVMGTVSAAEGDLVGSEAFFRRATSGEGTVPSAVLNDYADTLLCLGKIDEAERIARCAVKSSGRRFWVARLTLAQILKAKPSTDAATRTEIEELLKSVNRYRPQNRVPPSR